MLHVQCVHCASVQCKLLVMVVLVTGSQDAQPRPGCSLVSGLTIVGLTINFTFGLTIGVTIGFTITLTIGLAIGLAVVIL